MLSDIGRMEARSKISTISHKITNHIHERNSIDNGHVIVQTLKPFTTLSAIGMGYGITNTAVGLLLVIGVALPMGGSPLFFWGFLVMAVVGLCTAVTLSELTSAMPHPGGQYIWVDRLAPPRYRRFLSYVTAVVSWLAAVTNGASASLSVLIGVFAMVSLLNPDFVYEKWMGFLGFQLLNILTLALASFEQLLPKIAKLQLSISIAAGAAIFITLFAMSDTKTTPGAFFVEIVNVSGWPDGVAFIMGMNGANWSFGCLDVAVHLAEEIPSPETNIPRALIWTVAIGFLTGLSTIVAVLVNVNSIDGTGDNSALSLFYRITGNPYAAVGIWIPVMIATAGAVWSNQTWQSRLAWTISRDGGFPLHKHFSRLAPAPFHTPIWSMVMSASLIAILGCLYLGSDLAFNSLISTGILLQYISYSIPVVLMMWNGRSNFRHGPFWYPTLGLLANIIMLVWATVALVLYCFPSYLPVIKEQMNYASVVLVAIGILSVGLWFLFARDHYEVKEHILNENGASAVP